MASMWVQIWITMISGFPIIGGEGVVYYVDKDTAYVNGNEDNGIQIAVPSGLKALIGQFL
ncbi:hypothetical protein [Paenibacillus polymyxa]|uniref:hypothetical protein n=1 Tax=Paenibacillus polymyxa TaxID=1406 RepID=UPI0023F70780|nr:hypothetical protein [Paenibacillus polymyxa]